METLKNLIRLTIFSIVGLAAIFVSVHFASMNDDSVTLYWEMPEAESMMAAVILIVGLFALVLLIKLACCVGPIIGGIFKVILFPITLPFKVLGMFSGGGGGSYSAPSATNERAWWAKRLTDDGGYYNVNDKKTYDFHLSGEQNLASSIKANSYNEAYALAALRCKKNKMGYSPIHVQPK